MLISDSHKLILLLPQKCASETLQFRLNDIHDVTEFGKGMTYDPNTKKYYSKHIVLRKARKLEAYKKRPKHFKACFVRHPYSRAYSWFNWIVSITQTRIDNGFENRCLENIQRGVEVEINQRKINRFKKDIQLIEDTEADFNTFIAQNPNRFRPASAFTHHRNKQLVHFIGRVESFEYDYSKLCQAIGFTDSPTDSKKRTPLNEVDRAHSDVLYLNHYNEKSIHLINKAFSDDFKLLGYDQVNV
ncbi:MAG: sulfotransferase family 2 domain-containing protein [Opitutaceae bacterium]